MTVRPPQKFRQVMRIVVLNVIGFIALGIYGQISICLAFSGNRVLEIIAVAMFVVFFIIFGVPLMIMTFTIRPGDFVKPEERARAK
jgi:hypothetical protein